ncbi:MAG: serine/threonine protein kinase [Desulfatitalea sp.]|nr:serine/threonine protein kinase [Desulfatitalea sp.]
MRFQERVFTDTTEFFAIGPGDVILVGGKRYRVTGEEREYRFGIEDPKFWVKKAVDEESGARKILKLSFAETFFTDLGGVAVRCFRDPVKEGHILALVGDHPGFMHGFMCRDERNNPVRVLDIVRGTNFLNYIGTFRMTHEVYFWKTLPGVLQHLIEAFRAIGFLHANGFRHGDIRNDHVFVERGGGQYVWIDFDYDFEGMDNPFSLDIFGLGNLLIYAIGKGFHDYYMIRNEPFIYKDLADRLTLSDFSLLHTSRLVNLRKLYPYIPTMLNNILLNFSRGANVFYESAQEIIEDLEGYLESL